MRHGIVLQERFRAQQYIHRLVVTTSTVQNRSQFISSSNANIAILHGTEKRSQGSLSLFYLPRAVQEMRTGEHRNSAAVIHSQSSFDKFTRLIHSAVPLQDFSQFHEHVRCSALLLGGPTEKPLGNVGSREIKSQFTGLGEHRRFCAR